MNQEQSEMFAILIDLQAKLNKMERDFESLKSYVYGYEKAALIGKAELQRKLGVSSYKMIDLLIDRGELHPVRIAHKTGGKIYFFKKEVDEAIRTIGLSAGLNVETP